MAENFDLQSLCAFYDRGYLVPFIGSGMSRPACSDWTAFVTALEKQKQTGEPVAGASNLIQRALFALQALRQDGVDIAEAISKAVYCEDAKVPDQAVALASIYWPLVCTTNYDDIYLRAKLICQPGKAGAETAMGARAHRNRLPGASPSYRFSRRRGRLGAAGLAWSAGCGRQANPRRKV